jgi:lipopolysaccharide/colanic/teichoic acid biosynthesis glycosyltransferase/VanZ family protein
MKPESLMKKFFQYFLPPLLVMALIFPLGNQALASHRAYELFVQVFRWILPHASRHAAGLGYIIFRKSGHFFTYGFMAFLLYRAFRAGRGPRWKPAWLVQAAAVGISYGFLDELLQTFVPRRSGSSFDWAVDTAGIILALALTAWRANGMDEGRLPLPGPNSPSRALFLKRPFDFALSSAGLLLSSPLWALISLAIWLQDRGPVFYSQERVGRGGRTFKTLKFRSMILHAEKGRGPVRASENRPRATKVGRVLRATAMDELPQLLNILKGDMSFVGPRALRPDELEVHGNPAAKSIEDIPGYRERHAVRPGLTGLAQVFLPGATPRRNKFRYDLLYIRKMSFWTDLELIALSFWITFRGKWESREAKKDGTLTHY